MRDLGLLSLPQAVYKMTGGAAAALRLTDRGLLREGYRANVTLFDPATITDTATIDNPHQYATGIPMVLVNGEVVMSTLVSIPGHSPGMSCAVGQTAWGMWQKHRDRYDGAVALLCSKTSVAFASDQGRGAWARRPYPSAGAHAVF